MPPHSESHNTVPTLPFGNCSSGPCLPSHGYTVTMLHHESPLYVYASACPLCTLALPSCRTTHLRQRVRCFTSASCFPITRDRSREPLFFIKFGESSKNLQVSIPGMSIDKCHFRLNRTVSRLKTRLLSFFVPQSLEPIYTGNSSSLFEVPLQGKERGGISPRFQRLVSTGR